MEQGGSYYGTFQEPRPSAPPIPGPLPSYNSGGPFYPAVPGYPVLENYRSYQGSGSYPGAQYQVSNTQFCHHHYDHISERRLPFCGLGYGWFLFFLGFIFASIPWYIGAVTFLCLSHDYRERSGLIACTIAALVFLFLGGGLHVALLSGRA